MAYPDPHLFVQHLRDRLAALAVDARRLSETRGQDLPTKFWDSISLASELLRDWEQSLREYHARCEYPGAQQVKEKK